MRFLPSRLLPREDKFFVLLKDGAANMHEVAVLLMDLMEDYHDVPNKVQEIKRLEEVGDRIIHEIMRNLHRTFVTPLDREDIAALGERIDDIVDIIDELARNMVQYGIQEPTEKAIALARLVLLSAETLQQAIGKLQFRGAKLQDILTDAIEVNRLENEADQVVSQAVGELFANRASAIDVLKWKEIYDHLETATDLCEDAANVLEGIVLKHA